MVNYHRLKRVLMSVAIALLCAVSYLLWVNGARCMNDAHASPAMEELPSFPKSDNWKDVESDLSQTVDKVEKAILWKTKTHKRHKCRRDPEYRRALAEYIAEASAFYDLPWNLMTAIIFKESSFLPTVQGKLGEKGLTQVHGRAAMGCDLKTPRGQVLCGARWLRHCTDYYCKGNMRYGLAKYASGRVCKPDTKTLRDVVKARYRLAEKMRQVAEADN
jgi:hypothetical protein